MAVKMQKKKRIDWRDNYEIIMAGLGNGLDTIFVEQRFYICGLYNSMDTSALQWQDNSIYETVNRQGQESEYHRFDIRNILGTWYLM